MTDEVGDILDSAVPGTEDNQQGKPDSPQGPGKPEEAVAEKRVRDAQAALTEANQRIANLEGQLEAMRGEPQQKPEPLDLDKLSEQYRDDPAGMLPFFLERESNLRREFAEVLAERDQRFSDQLSRITEGPSRELIDERVKVLQRDPDFAALPPEALRVVARKSLQKREVRVPGAAGGRAAESRPAAAPEIEVPDGALARLMEGAGYSMEEKSDAS